MGGCFRLPTPALAEADLPEQTFLKDLLASFIFDDCLQYLAVDTNFKIAGRRLKEDCWKQVVPEHIDAAHLAMRGCSETGSTYSAG